MRIVEASREECQQLLSRASVGRLACSRDNQPYVIPICFAYEAEHLYVFSTLGKKVEWMRENPKVCVQVDEVRDRSDWMSVVVNGTYLELREPQYTEEKERARSRLSRFSEWWQIPLAERRENTSDVAIKLVFFRIDTASMSGLRGLPEAPSER
jgi:uncharacterized protein